MVCPNCGHEGSHSITDMFDQNKLHYICEAPKVINSGATNKYFIENVEPTNPLREVPFWGRGDGKNLSAIHALEWAQSYIELMNRELPCEENVTALCHIRLALAAQRERYRLRTQQGVLGTNRAHKPAAALPDIA